MKNAALVAHIRQLCCLGLGGRAIMPALLRAVRDLVPADWAEFFWIDASGEMTNHYAEQMLPADTLRFYFRRAGTGGEHPLFASFRTRAAQDDPVTTLTVTESFRRTELYRSVMQHLGAEHALYCVIRERGRCLGQLSLYRSGVRSPFTTAERNAIAGIANYIARGLDDSFGDSSGAALATSAGSARAPDEEPDQGWQDTDHQAMLTLDRNGSMRHCSSSARRLLQYVTLDSVNYLTLGSQEGAICDLMRGLAEQVVDASRIASSEEPATTTATITNRWGRFVLRAYWLTDDVKALDALIGVQIRRQEATVLRLSQAMHGLALSPQQKEVGLLLAQGKSNPEIASTLGVTLNTANYHVKQLFVKLNAHERTEVAPKLLSLGLAVRSVSPAAQAGSGR